MTRTKLLDRRAIVVEYGVTQHVAETWMRRLVKVHHPGGVKKDYVRASDLERMLADAEVRA